MNHTLLFALCAACATDVDVPKTPGVLVGEQYCKALELDCGKVYEFAAPADNPLGHVELCVLDEPQLELAVAKYGAAMLSTDPRFDEGNLCHWCCPSPTKTCPEKGANAYSGSFCPKE